MPELSSFSGAAPETILDWLVDRFPRIDREEWVRRIEAGLVTLDRHLDLPAQPVGIRQAYAPRRRVLYFREVEQEPRIPFEEAVVFQDEHLLVVDKPPFLPVTPSGPYVRECLLERLRGRFGPEVAPLHRLDRLTTGLVIFSRRPEERSVYGELFQGREILKEYQALAVVPRAPAWRRTTVRSRIVPGEPFFRMAECERGPVNAETDVRIERLAPADQLSRFRLRPRTGKTHQLRLHMARLGWPIDGDPLYPTLREKAPDRPDRPLRLLAARLSFVDPISGQDRDFVTGYRVENLPERQR